MSFRAKQKYRLSIPTIPIILEEKTLENGCVVREGVKANKDMPDPEMFKVENLQKAGVSMEEVNSKVLGCKSVNIDSFATGKNDDKQTDDNKQTNEE